jgi:hypothetical protein
MISASTQGPANAGSGVDAPGWLDDIAAVHRAATLLRVPEFAFFRLAWTRPAPTEILACEPSAVTVCVMDWFGSGQRSSRAERRAVVVAFSLAAGPDQSFDLVSSTERSCKPSLESASANLLRYLEKLDWGTESPR